MTRDPTRTVHFVGFRGDEYWSAVKIYGRPHVIHHFWDLRARADVGEGDLVVFARGEADRAPRTESWEYYEERYLL